MTETKLFTTKKYKLEGLWSRCRFELSTVDYNHLKSLNYDIKFYYTGDPEYMHLITNTMYRASRRIFEQYMDGALFRKDYVSINTTPETMQKSSSFISFEFTAYPTGKIKKDLFLETIFITISDRIHKEIFKDNHLVRSKR
jgi:hypothetical protein